MPTTLDPTLALAIRLFLALLFGFAAWSKLRNLSVFAEDLRGYRILSDGMVRMAAPGIALSEGALLLGLLLMPASPLPALGAARSAGMPAPPYPSPSGSPKVARKVLTVCGDSQVGLVASTPASLA